MISPSYVKLCKGQIKAYFWFFENSAKGRNVSPRTQLFPFIDLHIVFTSPSRGYICIAVCLWVCVSVFVCVCVSVSEQNTSQRDALIWTRFSLNGCLPHWLEPYWDCWPRVTGQGQSDVISIFFLHNSLFTSLL